MKHITLEASSLASKWGFGDGDALQDYLYDMQDRGLLKDFPTRDEFLQYIVRERLLPVIKARGIDVVVYDIGSIHNPIRAESVNGVEVHDRSLDPTPLDDISVTLDDTDILNLIAMYEARK